MRTFGRGHFWLEFGWVWSWSNSPTYETDNGVWDKLEKKWSLFDLEADRTETNDLAEVNAALAKRLAGQWSEWAAMTGLRR